MTAPACGLKDVPSTAMCRMSVADDPANDVLDCNQYLQRIACALCLPLSARLPQLHTAGQQ
jgi:hypothetical protein